MKRKLTGTPILHDEPKFTTNPVLGPFLFALLVYFAINLSLEVRSISPFACLYRDVGNGLNNGSPEGTDLPLLTKNLHATITHLTQYDVAITLFPSSSK